MLPVTILPPALGQADYLFTVDPAQSTVEFEATLIEFSLSDSDTSPVSGPITATLTPAGGPFSQIHMTELNLSLTEPIDMFFDGSIFQGDVVATGTDLKIIMDEEYGVPGLPAAVDGAGAFNQTGNLLQAAGTIDYQGTGIVFGLLGAGTINLLDYAPAPADLPGTVLDDGATVTLTMPLHATQTYNLMGIVNVQVVISGTIIATAPSQGGDIPGDLDGSGCVDQSDLGTLLADFGCTDGLGNCPGDADGDGDTDQSDLGILLGSFGAGC
jgi:hypothetical protein